MKTTLPSARYGQSIANEKAFCRIYRCTLPELCGKRAEELKEYLLSKYKLNVRYSSDLSTHSRLFYLLRRRLNLRFKRQGSWPIRRRQTGRFAAVGFLCVTLRSTLVGAMIGAYCA